MSRSPTETLPDLLPALAEAEARGVELALNGELLSPAEGLRRLAQKPHLICHAAYVIDRLGFAGAVEKSLIRQARETRHFDVAELFAFAAPAVAATPTPAGLATALGLAPGTGLSAIARHLLARMAQPSYPHLRETAEVAGFLARSNWPWAGPVIAALTRADARLDAASFSTGLNVWDRLEEWEDEGPRPPGAQNAIAPQDAERFLSELLSEGAEERPAQRRYAAEATKAFLPRESPQSNHILLAEAGTGLGKTLGYLAPSWLWARANQAPVWISTYTKNLQRQLEQETQKLKAAPGRVVIRKGRENYLCLLNLQEATQKIQGGPLGALKAALIARWARHSKDGDMGGGDFPAWLMSLLAPPGHEDTRSALALGLTDRRGECIFAACPHYRKCFIEKAIRAGRKADIVIANHALVLHQVAVDAALGTPQTNEDKAAPNGVRRLVFDEGHHLFDAADSAFSAELSGVETAELRRWIKGTETDRRRGRSLTDRLGDLAAEDGNSEKFLRQILAAANCLPGPGWHRRIAGNEPEGTTEAFLTLLRQQVLARSKPDDFGQSPETDCRPLLDGLAEAAGNLATDLIDLKQPMLNLAKSLAQRLDDEAAELSSTERSRIEALSRSLRRHAEMMLAGWIDMLGRLVEGADPMFVDWFSVVTQGGREMDAAYHSHWIDPTVPLANSVLSEADGVIITSATLKDRPPELPDDWRNAELRTGVVHLPWPVHRMSQDSPYDYRAQARVIVVNDVNRENMDQVAAAYRELFLAARGGALGLFTAIHRLKQVYQRLSGPIARAGLPLYAQHIDPIDTGTLVDMFRAERDACLLGTDAVRDGVDVPGDSLRLIVLDRVPWAQPSILERARRAAFGASLWQDMVVRLKLRQAFGRRIRRASDRGVFVVLDPRMASRFATAFPKDMEIERMGLADAITATAEFLRRG